MTANNHAELNELRRVEESMEDAIGRLKKIMDRADEVDDLRAAAADINQKQADLREKRRKIREAFNRRCQEFALVDARCDDLESEFDQIEDGIQDRSFRLLELDMKDVGKAADHAVTSRSGLTSWREKWRTGRREKVTA
jgi:chromosome segregation ATPase